jgi:phospholipid transport system transporter-binding protein
VCAFIEWKREAQKKNCRLIFCNIPPRLRDLIKLYQLSDLFSS